MMPADYRVACDPDSKVDDAREAVDRSLLHPQHLSRYLRANTVRLPFRYNATRTGQLEAVVKRDRLLAEEIQRVEERQKRMLQYVETVAEHGVWTMSYLLKGLPLANLYPERCRDIGDIDIVVRNRADLRQLLGALAKSGVTLQKLRVYDIDEGFGEMLFYIPTFHLSLTVHYGGVPVVGGTRLLIDLSRGEKEVSLGQVTVNVPSAEHLLAIICANTLRHGYCKWRDVLDFSYVVGANHNKMDWAYLHEVCALNKLLAVYEGFMRFVKESPPLPTRGSPFSWRAFGPRLCKLSCGSVASPLFVGKYLVSRRGFAYGLLYGLLLGVDRLRRHPKDSALSRLSCRAGFSRRRKL
jgi:hypothetical protein